MTRVVRLRALALAALALAACAKVGAPPIPASAKLIEEHCWWAVMRSTMPHDSVASRFAAAFAQAGLPAVRTQRLGDTTWVTAGVGTAPAEVANSDASARFTSRVVTYQRGDSTHYRQFVAHTAGVSGLGICVPLSKAASVGALALKEPDGEEKLPVWSRK